MAHLPFVPGLGTVPPVGCRRGRFHTSWNEKRDSSMSPRVKRCMTGATHPLERAFDLARTGRFAGVAEIRKQLRIEGLDARQVEGRLLSQQLRKLISEARNSTAER